jgi:hypothetical protein
MINLPLQTGGAMNAFVKLVGLLAIPLILILAFGDIVSGVWLALLREWRVIGWGFGVAIFGVLFLSIALMLGLLLDGPAALLHRRGHVIASYALGFLSLCYTLTLLSLWCWVVMLFFAEQVHERSFIPGMIWSFGAAMAPLAWLSQKVGKRRNEYESVTLFFCGAAYLVVMLAALLLRGVPVLVGIMVFGIAMLCALVVEIGIALDERRRASRNREATGSAQLPAC